jgi:hypothetical protein
MTSFYFANIAFAVIFGMGALALFITYLIDDRKYKVLLVGLFPTTLGLLVNIFVIATHFFNLPYIWRVLSDKVVIASMPIIAVCGVALWFKIHSDDKQKVRPKEDGG